MTRFVKYPRTPHLRGSRRSDGDHDLEQVGLEDLRGGTLIWEEKLDGANAAFSFDRDGRLLLQSRGHFLHGGAREGQFSLMKAWVETHRDAFRDAIAARYIVCTGSLWQTAVPAPHRRRTPATPDRSRWGSPHT